MNARRAGRRAAIAAVAASLLAVAGCVTAPVRPAAAWLGVLPDDAALYLSLDVRRSADLLQEALAGAGPDLREVGPLLERTDRLYGAVESLEGSFPRLSLVALGSYPAGLIRSRLCCSRSWTTVRSSSGTYYASAKVGVQVGVPAGFAVLVSTGSLETLLARFEAPKAPPMPTEAAEGMETADLSLYLPELPGGLGGTSGPALPVREVWAEGRRAGDRFEVRGAANAASERDARSLVLLLRLALVAWMRTQGLSDVSGRLKTVTVAAEGSRVKVSGLWFGKDEIVPVLLGLAGRGASGAVSPPDAGSSRGAGT